jgi:arylsulfatase A-like enzyme
MRKLSSALLFAFIISFTDILLAFAEDPAGFTTVVHALPAWGATVVLSFILFLAIALPTGSLVPMLRRNPNTAPIVLGATLWLSFTLMWLFHLFSLKELVSNLALALIQIGTVIIAALLMLFGSQRLFEGVSAKSRLRGVRALCIALGVSSIIPFASSNRTFEVQASSVHRTPQKPDHVATLPGPPRHVILISVDTLRKDALGVYGSSSGNTPYLDNLATESVVFNNAYSSGPWTIPSFTSIHTGLPVAAHQTSRNFASIPLELKTLAEAYSANGFLTAAIGYHPQLLRMNRGFSNFDFAPKRNTHHPSMVLGRFFSRFVEFKRTGETTVKLAGDWIKENKERSCFLWVHLLEPHIHYEPPVEHLPQTSLVQKFGPRFDSKLKKDVRDGNIIRLSAERKWLRSLYNAEISYADRIVGSLLERLKELGIYEDALIILLSDHGEEFWEHGNWEHGHSLYNELVNVPFLMKLSGGGAQKVVEPVSTAGLFSTLAELNDLSGVEDTRLVPSFLWLFQDEIPEASKSGPDPIFLGGVEYFEPREAVIWGSWKFILHEREENSELYNLIDDPLETESVIDKFPLVAQHGKELLESHLSAFPPLNSSLLDSEVPPNEAEALRQLGYSE